MGSRGTYVLQREPGQGRTDPLTLVGAVDLRVRKHDQLRGELVFRSADDSAVLARFVPLPLGIVRYSDVACQESAPTIGPTDPYTCTNCSEFSNWPTHPVLELWAAYPAEGDARRFSSVARVCPCPDRPV
jgi:hypothetical protein